MERILFPASNGSLLRLTVDIVEVEVQASQGNDPGDNSNRQGLPAKYFVNSVNWLISCTNIAECMCILIVNCFMCWFSFVSLSYVCYPKDSSFFSCSFLAFLTSVEFAFLATAGS